MAPSSFLTFVLCALAASFIGVHSTPIAHQYEVRQATSSSALPPSVSGVPPPTNVASGTLTGSCTEYYIALPGDTCATIENTFGISLTQIIALNPEINSQCTNFFAEEAYCVSSAAITGPPANLVVGSLTPAEGCVEYYTIESGDTCNLVAGEWGLSFAQFVALNPEINAQCTNLFLGLAYCVAGTPAS
ncbi:hypothetical protein B0H16DRAFT_1620823 [Mycena metata]|uniref:LysM domain-containing protein n=1 Tax=Mycena metata TaxID=1033252 RepID=A0AAD7H7U4_9AGAR|nr:hypothetical protein B0H16DRAFT_1620823 [Mycena metata]